MTAPVHLVKTIYVGTGLTSIEIYEKLRLVEKTFEILKIYPTPAMFDTAYIMADGRLLFFVDALRQEGFEKEKLN